MFFLLRFFMISSGKYHHVRSNVRPKYDSLQKPNLIAANCYKRNKYNKITISIHDANKIYEEIYKTTTIMLRYVWNKCKQDKPGKIVNSKISIRSKKYPIRSWAFKLHQTLLRNCFLSLVIKRILRHQDKDDMILIRLKLN